MATKRKTTAKRPVAKKAAAKRPAAKKVAAKKATAKKPAVAAAKRPAAKKSAASNANWKDQTAALYGSDVRNTAEQMMKASGDMMQQFFGKDGAKFAEQFKTAFDAKGADKAFAFGNDAAEQLTQTANTASRTLNEAAEISRENAEAMVECGNIAVNVSKQMSSELIGFANKSFAQNVELSKQAFACRTINDVFDLQNRAMKSGLDALFAESVKMSEMMFQCASEISEPLNERMAESADRLTKASAA